MQLGQRKQQQWQLYMASVAATTLVVRLERGSFWNAFQAANDSTLTALDSIGTTIEFSDSTFAAVEESSARSVTRKPISQRWIS